jgi:hypothetical protein
MERMLSHFARTDRQGDLYPVIILVGLLISVHGNQSTFALAAPAKRATRLGLVDGRARPGRGPGWRRHHGRGAFARTAAGLQPGEEGESGGADGVVEPRGTDGSEMRRDKTKPGGKAR